MGVPRSKSTISLAEESPDSLSTGFSIIGLSSGQLAAAATSSFSNPLLFVPVAVEIVRIAFRLGLHVETVAGRLHQCASHKGSWSFSVSSVTELVARCAIDDFHRESVSTYYHIDVVWQLTSLTGDTDVESSLHQ